MVMDVKAEVNGGTPLPQRVPKNQQGAIKKPMQNQQKPDNSEGAPAEKKPRFSQPQGGVGNQNKGGTPNRGGFAGARGGGQNRGGMNQNRGGLQQNRGNFQNQQNQQQQQNKPQQQQANADAKQDAPKTETAPAQAAAANSGPAKQPAGNQQQPQEAGNQQNQNNQNRGRNQGGGPGGFAGNKQGGGVGNQGGFGQGQGGQGQGGFGGNKQQGGDGRQGGFVGNKQQGQGGGQGQGGFGGNKQQGGDGRQGGFGGNKQGGGGGGGGGGFGNRDRSRGGPGDNRGGGGPGGRGDDFFILQRLRTMNGPTHEIPPIDSIEEAKFSGRNRLYVGNLTNDITEEELRELFKPYGEIGELFMNTEKNFSFLKMDYHANAEKAKRGLDGTLRKGRSLRVRFAPNATILKVSNLTPFVSNELLYKSFEVFGPIERASIIVDERGKHTGEGIVEFERKNSANACMRFCNDKCYFLTASLRPCVVEPFEMNEDNDGLPDKSLNKKIPEFHHERSVGPRFAELNSFEHEYGTRWKQLHELFKTKKEALKRELVLEEEKLEAQMEYARYEHDTEMLRQELRKRESDNERKKMEWEMREKNAEEMRKREEENLRRQQNDMQSRMQRQEEEMRRRQQENTLFMQAQQLNSLLDQQEGGFGAGGGSGGGGNNNFDNFGGAAGNSPFEFRSGNAGAGGANNNAPNNPQESFSFEFGGNQNQGGNQGNQRGNQGGNNNNPWERRRRF